MKNTENLVTGQEEILLLAKLQTVAPCNQCLNIIFKTQYKNDVGFLLL